MANLTVDVLDPAGKKAGSAELPGDIFDVQTNVALIHQVVTAQLNAARQGTHKVKTRGEVSGGGKKPWKQKGTGRARQGSTRAPQWTGGGVVHGPTPRDYSERTPKKMKAAALRGALSDRARTGRIHVVTALLEGDKPSTRSVVKTLAHVADRQKFLIVVRRDDELGALSSRNLEFAHVLFADQLNTYDVMRSEDVVFTSDALEDFVAAALAAASKAPKKSQQAAPKAAPAQAKQAAPAPAEEAEQAEAAEAPYGEGSALPLADGSAPEGFAIKGNKNSMKFHAETSPWYNRTVAEVYFADEAAAEKAGFVNAEVPAEEDDK